MKAVIQRVTFAQVKVEGKVLGEIENGFLILLGVCEGDTENESKLLADKTAKLRIFNDDAGKMNLSLLDFKDNKKPCSVLVISQFTLCANTRRGNRPDFFAAAKPETAKKLYELFAERLSNEHGIVTKTGEFGADMKVSLLNDGPVTIILDTDDMKK